MGEREYNGTLEKGLKEKLNWYTRYASEEEFDEKAVESILYLLDHTDPLEENTLHTPDEAWEKFQEIVKNQRELLPLSEDKLPRNPYAPDDKPKNRRPGKGKIAKFVQSHKILAAAALLLLILAVSGTIQAGANVIQNNGFFFWMKRDDTGIEMITSPEDLDVKTGNIKRQVYQSRDELPDWTKEWLEIEAEFEMPDNYEWQYYETNEFAGRNTVSTDYLNEKTKEEIILGVWIYFGTAYYREEFIGYNYVQSYEIDQKQMDVYNRIEETGEVFYMICFYEGNYKYFMWGQDNLEELKILTEQYWACVEKNKK